MASSVKHPEKLRKEGNKLYKQVSEGGFCLTVRKAKLQRAHDLYTQALNCSSIADEKASSCKNLGMLHWLWCKVELNELVQNGAQSSHDGAQTSLSPEQLLPCKYHLFETIIFLLQAKDHATNAKPQTWLDHLDLSLMNIVEWATEQSSLLSDTPHSPLLQYLCQAFENASPLTSPARASLLAFRNHADTLFKQALALKLPDDSMDYKVGLSLLHASCLALRKAESIPTMTIDERSLQEELKGLQESVNVHVCICEAMQAIELGDKALTKGVMNGEDIDMEEVKDALDYYRQASLATREMDMETEAIAMSRIGKVYSEVYKMEEVAHKHHFQATKLALAVMSPSIARAEWYKYSLTKVKEHQEKVAAREREEKERDRRPVLERIADQVDKLAKESHKSAESFLKFLYSEHVHPDIERNIVLPSFNGDKDKVKAALKKAIHHYHPDNNLKFGEEWKVLCEEICKHLNCIYEYYK